MAVRVAEANDYAEAVVCGDITACQFVNQACRRYLDDLDNGADRGLVFDPDAAQDVLDFYDYLPHIKGEWAGQPIVPSPWQAFGLVNLYGWKQADTGLRRFRTAYFEVGRKNGKSTFVAPVGLYMTRWDDEPGAEVVSAATSRDQARIVFDTARDMVRNSKVRDHIQVFNHSICEPFSSSSFKPLASDSDTLEGKNLHCAIIDELHAHKSRRVYDVLELACASRSQPLLLVITTAGTDMTGICYEMRTYLTRVLDGTIVDDSLFGAIYTLDDGDDWKDRKVWIKANPNLGVSVKVEDMERLCTKAQESPAFASEFKTKRLNVWSGAADAFFNMERWRACPVLPPEPRLVRLPCWLGLDLSSKLDLTALAILFADEDRRYHLRARFWLPEQALQTRARHLAALYRTWVNAGWIDLTPGEIIDYRFIREAILQLCGDLHDVREIAYDPHGATQLAIQLHEDDGLPMVELRQTYTNLSEPMRELEALIIDRRISHDRNPVLDWCLGNTVARIGVGDHVLPAKEHFDNKIDGTAATVTALSRALVNHDETSVYRSRGLLVL